MTYSYCLFVRLILSLGEHQNWTDLLILHCTSVLQSRAWFCWTLSVSSVLLVCHLSLVFNLILCWHIRIYWLCYYFYGRNAQFLAPLSNFFSHPISKLASGSCGDSYSMLLPLAIVLRQQAQVSTMFSAVLHVCLYCCCLFKYRSFYSYVYQITSSRLSADIARFLWLIDLLKIITLPRCFSWKHSLLLHSWKLLNQKILAQYAVFNKWSKCNNNKWSQSFLSSACSAVVTKHDTALYFIFSSALIYFISDLHNFIYFYTNLFLLNFWVLI